MTVWVKEGRRKRSLEGLTRDMRGDGGKKGGKLAYSRSEARGMEGMR